MIQYPFAIDEAGVLTSIESVDAEHRHDHSYRCPECGGEMRPRLGRQRAHCFYHADDHECDVESYVHKVGKELLCKRFLIDGIPFNYKRVVRCSRYSSCADKSEWLCEREEKIVTDKPNSQQKEHSLFDALAYKFLSDYYDVAEIEKAFGDFRPDVLLTSSIHPDRRPFFLEICYKHPCSEEKKDSGYPIMEVTVSRVEDLNLIQSVDVFSSVNNDCPLKVVFYGFRPKLLPVEDYMKAVGLQRRDFPCTDEYKRENPNLIRVSFFPFGKTDRRNVISIDEAHNEKAVFEITYDRTSFPGSFCPEELVARKNPLYRNCDICCYCRNWEENTWCQNDLNGLTRKGTFDKLKARECGAFTPRGMSPEASFDSVNNYLCLWECDYWFNPQFPSDMAPWL